MGAALIASTAHATITHQIEDTAEGVLIRTFWDGPPGVGLWDGAVGSDNGNLRIIGSEKFEADYSGGLLQRIQMPGHNGEGSRIAEGYNAAPERVASNVLPPFAKASFSTSRISSTGPGFIWGLQWSPDSYYLDSSDDNGWEVFTNANGRQPVSVLLEGSFASLGIIPGVTNEFWLGTLTGFPGAEDQLPVRLRTVATASLELRLEATAGAYDVDFSAVYGGSNPHTGDTAFAPGTLSLDGSALRESLMGNTYVVTLDRNAPAENPPPGSAIAAVNCTGGSDPGTVSGNDLIVEVGPEETVICTLDMDALCGTNDGAVLGTAPTAGLCAVGTPTAVSGTGPWAWDCEAGRFGASASCAADLATYPITLVPPVGAGSVNCTPNQVSHGDDASCTATPEEGHRLVEFTGDCTGTSCLLTNVTGPLSVGATFAELPAEEEAEEEEEEVAEAAADSPRQIPTLPLPALMIVAVGLLGWGLRRLKAL